MAVTGRSGINRSQESTTLSGPTMTWGAGAQTFGPTFFIFSGMLTVRQVLPEVDQPELELICPPCRQLLNLLFFTTATQTVKLRFNVKNLTNPITKKPGVCCLLICRQRSGSHAFQSLPCWNLPLTTCLTDLHPADLFLRHMPSLSLQRRWVYVCSCSNTICEALCCLPVFLLAPVISLSIFYGTEKCNFWKTDVFTV